MQELKDKQAKDLANFQKEQDLEQQFAGITGTIPSIIIGRGSVKSFAVFRPKTAEVYRHILTALKPEPVNFTLTFSGKAPIPTFSPYSVHYGGLHNSPNYMSVTVKFKHRVCPVWVEMPDEMKSVKFAVSVQDGKHLGFGNYEKQYTYKALTNISVMHYYGENKVLYAATIEEATALQEFIF